MTHINKNHINIGIKYFFDWILWTFFGFSSWIRPFNQITCVCTITSVVWFELSPSSNSLCKIFNGPGKNMCSTAFLVTQIQLFCLLFRHIFHNYACLLRFSKITLLADKIEHVESMKSPINPQHAWEEPKVTYWNLNSAYVQSGKFIFTISLVY